MPGGRGPATRQRSLSTQVGAPGTRRAARGFFRAPLPVPREISGSRDWKSRGHTCLSLRLAGALAEPVSGGGSVAPLHLQKALRAWPNAIRKCAAASDPGR